MGGWVFVQLRGFVCLIFILQMVVCWFYMFLVCFMCVLFLSCVLSVGVVAVMCQYTKLSVFPYMGDGINWGFSSLFLCLFCDLFSLERVKSFEKTIERLKKESKKGCKRCLGRVFYSDFDNWCIWKDVIDYLCWCVSVCVLA